MAGRGELRVEVRRSQLGRVRGLGAARSGLAVWWAERLTSVALIPLTLWFVFAVLTHLGATAADMHAWMAQPANAALMLALVLVTFHHAQLGLVVIIEDYVHREAARMVSIVLVKGACALLALACVVATFKLAV